MILEFSQLGFIGKEISSLKQSELEILDWQFYAEDEAWKWHSGSFNMQKVLIFLKDPLNSSSFNLTC